MSFRRSQKETSISYASTSFHLGIAFLEMERYDSAKFHLRQSLRKREELSVPLLVALSKLEMGRLYMEIGNLDSASYYLDESNILEEKEQFREVHIYHSIYNGQLETLRGNYHKAIESIKSSLSYLNDFNFKELRVKSLYLLGSIYSEIGNYDGALDNLLRAESLNASFKNMKQQAQIDFVIGYIHYYQKNIDKAREAAISAYDKFKQIGLDRKEAAANNLLGLIELYVKDYEASARYFDRGMRIYQQLNYQKGIASILYNKSYIYLEQGETEKVIQIQLDALEIEKQINNTSGIIISYNSLGNIYHKKGELKKAENCLLLANELLKKHPSPSYEEENNLFLSELYQSKSDFKKAYEYLKLSKKNSDSVFSQNSITKSLQLSAIHDIEKKELEIQNLNQDQLTKNIEIALKESQLKQQRLLIYIGSFAILFFCFLSYFLFKIIKKLRATQQELIKAEKRASMGILIAGLGHEMNNPLNFIKVGLECLKRSKDDWSEDQNNFINAIGEGVKRTSAIISFLNQFEKKKNSKMEPCDLTLILQDSISMLTDDITEEKKVQISKADTNATVSGYPGELKQLFKELIRNSLESIQGAGKVSIEISTSNSQCIIKIIDDGIGINDENLSLLENLFFTTKAPNDGKGFGLYLVDYILNDHDGTIHFDSKVGKGTEVTVVLPK